MKRFFAASIAVWTVSASAFAIPITFTLRGSASGSANGVLFGGAPFTVSYSSDTALLIPSDVVEFYPQMITSVSIGGVGNGTFTNTFYLNKRAFASFVNLTDTRTGNNFLLIYPGLAKYPFDAAFGPVPVILDPKTPLPTNNPSSLGNISFTSLDNLTFEAVTPTVPPSPTPIPSTLILALTGLAAAGLFYKRLRLSKIQAAPVRPA